MSYGVGHGGDEGAVTGGNAMLGGNSEVEVRGDPRASLLDQVRRIGECRPGDVGSEPLDHRRGGVATVTCRHVPGSTERFVDARASHDEDT